ncbi:MAG: hypothetical protein NC182_07085 [Prevotella sp.]|nr:hypothetical protein [Staphylococcus sp.]MCM1350945.1 hypothetical protein [Prevotella sp.]
MDQYEEVIIDGNQVKNKEKRNRNKFSKKISKAMPLLALTAFLILGFCKNAWHPGWVVFLSIPLTEVVLSVFKKEGKAKYVSIAFIVSIIAYAALGFCLDAWHPGWLVFFLVPIVSIFAE